MASSPALPRGTLLLVQFSADCNGSAISGLSLASGLREQGWRIHVAFGHPGPMETEYQMAGHHCSVVEHKSWLRRAQPLRFAKDFLVERRKAADFERLLGEIHPDVVYLNTAVSLAAAVAARRCNIPLIWHLRELFSDVGGEMQAPVVAKPLVRKLFRRLSDSVVVNSRAVAENLIGLRHADSATVIPNAVSEECFDRVMTKQQARQLLGLPDDVRVVGVPGTLRPVKGHAFLLRSVARLVSGRDDIAILITGEGEKFFVQKLQEEAQRLGLARNVIFTGALDGLTTFFRACDVVCVPSRSEAFGRVVIEAFAAASPVVATAVGGIPEIVDDGVNGLLVPYGDEFALEAALARLLEDTVLRERLAHNAREKADHEYREARYQDRISQLVDAVANRGSI